MKRYLHILWPAVGIGAVLLSLWLLSRELRGITWAQVEGAFGAIRPNRWVLAAVSSAVAYAALAWYDRIALLHLGFRLHWRFISAVSFTTYALSHNIGMSMFSGAMVRYRAYSSKGLTVTDVGVLVAFCSFTFALGTVLLGGFVLLYEPEIVDRLFNVAPALARLAGVLMLLSVALYIGGAAMHLRPLRIGELVYPRLPIALRRLVAGPLDRIGSFELVYPRLPIALRQLLAGPLELMGAAGIIWCALPPETNPGFLIVLGVFLASFSAALLSHAPGGVGVFEFVFITAMPNTPRADVLAALLVFRLLYLVIPLILGIVAVIAFERSRMLHPPADS